MSVNRCIEIDIYQDPTKPLVPFKFGMSGIIKFAKVMKWEAEPAVEIVTRLMTMGGSHAAQSDYHKIAASAAAIEKGIKAPPSEDIEEAFLRIVQITQNEVYPILMADLGIDVKPALEKVSEEIKKAAGDVKQ